MQRFLILLLSIVLSVQFLQAQSIEQTLDKVALFQEYNPQEKIYIHTDRNAYSVGETIWFKSYSTLGIENLLSTLSSITYVELIDPLNRIVSDTRLATTLGVGLGNIALVDTLIEGTYRLRAYTNWMRNYGEDFFFEKSLNISNGRIDDVISSTSQTTEGNNTFYTVSLKTINGTPLAKTSVRYEVWDGEKSIDKVRETTDENGLIKIKINDKIRGKSIRLNFANLNKRNVSKVINTRVFDSDNSLQVLPEGGHLLAGTLNNVAFKSLQPNGLGIQAKIEIVNSQSESVASIETNELGMGSISIFPVDGERYTAEVNFSDGTSKNVEIPQSKTSGLSLIVNTQNSSRIFAQVNLSEDLFSDKEIYFIVHQYGTILYVSKQQMKKSDLVFSVNRSTLPNGILTISLLNADFQPVFERPVFNVNMNSLLSIGIDLEKETFGTRDLVKTTLKVGDSQDSLRMSSLSASVTNTNKLIDTADLQSHILSSMLLESDLKGHIENPGYYFKDISNIKSNEIDQLLLTQGWRKLPWSDIQLPDSIKKYQPEKGITVKGYARKIGRKAPVPGANIQLISTNDYMDFIDTIATADGYFEFDNLLFPDSVKFLLSAKDEKGKNNIDIFIEESEKPVIKSASYLLNDINNIYAKELQASKRFLSELENKGLLSSVIEIEEVTVRAERKKAPEHSRNLNGPGNADQIITSDDLSTCSTLEMCLNGRLLGVIFQNGVPHNTRGMTPMQIVLDGMYVEADMLMTITPTDIASVEVLRNVNYTAIYGSFGGNGVIVITTKIGHEGRLNYQPRGLLTIQPKGITTIGDFYKPTYEIGSEETFGKDLRTTIHWEPTIVTNEKGEAVFDFYTSDEPGKYRIVIEGIDLNGRIGRKVVEFEVK